MQFRNHHAEIHTAVCDFWNHVCKLLSFYMFQYQNFVSCFLCGALTSLLYESYVDWSHQFWVKNIYTKYTFLHAIAHLSYKWSTFRVVIYWKYATICNFNNNSRHTDNDSVRELLKLTIYVNVLTFTKWNTNSFANRIF